MMHYKTIWVVLFGHVLLYFVQEMAFMLAVYSEKDLGQLIRLNYTPFWKKFVWIFQEIAIISADI